MRDSKNIEKCPWSSHPRLDGCLAQELSAQSYFLWENISRIQSAMAEKPTIAIFNVAMIGHVNPTFPLVQELVRRGCNVHYFLPPVKAICAAAKESGAIVESYLPDVPDLVLDQCGIQDLTDDILPEDRELWKRATWPLASTLLCGDYIIQRCRDLRVSAVLYDPMTPHGLLVALKLDIPKASLITFPGMGSLRDLMSQEDRLKKSASIRVPLGEVVKETFGVDLEVALLTRRQWLAPLSFITTGADLVVPLPAEGAWAKELQDFRFLPVGCLVSSTAPHVTLSTCKAKTQLPNQVVNSFGNDLPTVELEEQVGRGRKIIFAALGTMALADRWDQDLGKASGGNLPAGVKGKQFCQHVWKVLIQTMEDLGEDYFCVLCIGKQPDALDFLDAESQDLPSNMLLKCSVPQVAMLNKYASVFISHAGFNSLQESLMAGVPLVAVPQAVDQPANALKVQQCSWGISFLKPMESLTQEALAASLCELSKPTSHCRSTVASARTHLTGGVQCLAQKLLDMKWWKMIWKWSHQAQGCCDVRQIPKWISSTTIIWLIVTGPLIEASRALMPDYPPKDARCKLFCLWNLRRSCTVMQQFLGGCTAARIGL